MESGNSVALLALDMFLRWNHQRLKTCLSRYILGRTGAILKNAKKRTRLTVFTRKAHMLSTCSGMGHMEWHPSKLGKTKS